MSFLFKQIESYLDSIDSAASQVLGEDQDGEAAAEKNAEVADDLFPEEEGSAGRQGSNEYRMSVSDGSAFTLPVTADDEAPSALGDRSTEAAGVETSTGGEDDSAPSSTALRIDDLDTAPVSDTDTRPELEDQQAVETALPVDATDPSALQEELENMRSDLKLAKSKIQRLELENKSITKERSLRSAEVEKSVKENQNLLARIQNLNDQIKELQKIQVERNRLASQVESLLKHIETMKQEQIAPEQVQEIEGKLLKERQEKDSLKREFDARVSAWETERNDLQTTAADLQTALDELERERLRVVQELASSKEQVERGRREYSEYKARAHKLLQKKDSEIDKLQETVDGLSSGALNQSAAGGQPQQDVAVLLTQIKELEHRLEGKEETVRQLEDSIAKQQRNSEATQERLESDLMFERDANKQLEQELREARKTLELSKTELGHTQRQLAEIRNQETETNSSYEATIAALRRELTAAQEKSMSAEDGSGSLLVSAAESESLHLLRTEIIQRQQQVESLLSEKHALEMTISDLSRKLQDSQQRAELLSVQTSSNKTIRRGWALSESRGNSHLDKSGPVRISLDSSFADSPIVDPENLSADPDHPTSKFFQDLSRRGRVGQQVVSAASHVDQLSLEAGRLLARYPLARVLLVLYFLLFHLWIWFVLFSKAHSLPARTEMGPPAPPGPAQM